MKFRLKAPQEKRFFGARDAIGCWSLVIVSARLIWLSLSFVVLPGGKGRQVWYMATSMQAKRVASSRREQLTRPYWAAIPAVPDFVVAPPNKARGLM